MDYPNYTPAKFTRGLLVRLITKIDADESRDGVPVGEYHLRQLFDEAINKDISNGIAIEDYEAIIKQDRFCPGCGINSLSKTPKHGQCGWECNNCDDSYFILKTTSKAGK